MPKTNDAALEAFIAAKTEIDAMRVQAFGGVEDRQKHDLVEMRPVRLPVVPVAVQRRLDARLIAVDDIAAAAIGRRAVADTDAEDAAFFGASCARVMPSGRIDFNPQPGASVTVTCPAVTSKGRPRHRSRCQE